MASIADRSPANVLNLGSKQAVTVAWRQFATFAWRSTRYVGGEGHRDWRQPARRDQGEPRYSSRTSDVGSVRRRNCRRDADHRTVCSCRYFRTFRHCSDCLGAAEVIVFLGPEGATRKRTAPRVARGPRDDDDASWCDSSNQERVDSRKGRPPV